MVDQEESDVVKEEPLDPIVAWDAHIKSVLRSRDRTLQRMDANRRRAKELDRKYGELAMQQGYTLKEMQNAITVYSQLLCRPFCEKIHAAFPRELRDRIYGYLLGPRSETPTPRFSLIKQRRREIWFSESWVGRDFTIEICEMAYRTDNLQLCGTFNLNDLLLRSEDNGVLPAAHMRSLVLRIDLSYRNCVLQCCMPALVFRPPPPPIAFTPDELKKSLDPLFKIHRIEGFHLDIVLGGYFSEQSMLEDLELMREPLTQLKELGMKISIIREFMYQETNRYPENLMSFYDGTREDWDRACQEHRDRLKSKGIELIPPSPSPPPPPMMMPPPLPPHPPLLPNPPPVITIINTGTQDSSDDDQHSEISEGEETDISEV